MHDITKGVLAGAGLILLLAVLFKAEVLLPQSAASAAIKVDVLTIGPDGKPDSAYGDELENVEVPGSADYQLCTVSEVMVKRPPMFTSDMPDAYCRLTRGNDGKWLVSTGGWQECRVSCVRIGG